MQCPRCKSQLEVDAIGDFVACFHCRLEFTVDEQPVDEQLFDEPTVDEPTLYEQKTRKSIWTVISKFRLNKISWFKLFVWSFLILLLTFLFCGSLIYWWLIRSKVISSPFAGGENLNLLLGGTGLFLFTLAFWAIILFLFVNIVLWIFIPVLVFSINKKLAEAVSELKKLNNI